MAEKARKERIADDQAKLKQAREALDALNARIVAERARKAEAKLKEIERVKTELAAGERATAERARLERVS